MSYCRWSSDGHRCDVYVYEDVSGGFTCHVASRRIVNLDEAPQCPNFSDYESPISDADIKELVEKHRVWMEWLEHKAIRENIGLELDGVTFNTDTATGMANELSLARIMGYNVPQYAIDALYEEGLENGEQQAEL